MFLAAASGCAAEYVHSLYRPFNDKYKELPLDGVFSFTSRKFANRDRHILAACLVPKITTNVRN